MEIRTATTADVETIVSLWVELMQLHQPFGMNFETVPQAVGLVLPEINKRISDPNTRVFLAGEGAGMIIVFMKYLAETMKHRRIGYIAETVVNEKFRRQGVGEKLFEAARNWLVDQGAEYLELQVSPQNAGARKFWVDKGFTVSTEHMVLPVTGS